MAANTNAKIHQTTPTGRDAHGDEPLTVAKNYFVEKRGDQWCVVDSTRTKTLGCHPSKAEAEAQLNDFALAIAGIPPWLRRGASGRELALDLLQALARVQGGPAETWPGLLEQLTNTELPDAAADRTFCSAELSLLLSRSSPHAAGATG